MTDKDIKRYFNMTALGFFSYALILQILAVIVAALLGLLFPEQDSSLMYYSMMISVIPCMLFLYFLFRNNTLSSLQNDDLESSYSPLSGGNDSKEKAAFSPLIFLHYFVIFCGVQWISALFTLPLIFCFEKLGLDLSYSEMAAKGGALDDVPMLVYTILIAPIVEELVFRGIFYKRFKVFGSFLPPLPVPFSLP